jgi:hypothetical protein
LGLTGSTGAEEARESAPERQKELLPQQEARVAGAVERQAHLQELAGHGPEEPDPLQYTNPNTGESFHVSFDPRTGAVAQVDVYSREGRKTDAYEYAPDGGWRHLRYDSNGRQTSDTYHPPEA